MPKRWLFPDHVLWKIGDWEVRRPFREALLDVLIDHLKYTFGMEWAQEQYALPEEDRHVVMRWWYSVCAQLKEAAPPNHVRGQFIEVPRTGNVMEYGWLADDLYRLRLVDALDPAVIARLRSHDQFQGARYEIAIAASLVRAGFDIRWLNGTDKHCEFEATQRLTHETIAVEVKSRHVPGTLNNRGVQPDLDEIGFVAHRYYNQAIQQCPVDKPCAIFINLNMPMRAFAEGEFPWEAEIKAMSEKLPQSNPSSPSVENCLVLTNFAAHY